jgi:hypothetical protein
MNEEELTVQTIVKIKEFMFADLDKTIALVNSSNGAPNFMLALVLCCYTEFWGKLMLYPERDEKKCFDSFFCKLGLKYCDLIYNSDAGIYGRVRCGVVHEYSIKTKADSESMIVIEGRDCEIVYDKKTQNYTFCVRKYFEDFKIAVNNYIEELKTESDKFNHAKQALEGKEIKLI